MSDLRYGLRHIRCFMALASELHFGRTAASLHLAQPALSKTIRELEDVVGARLFVRTTRKVDLTDAGKAFLAECRPAIRHLERAAEQARYAAAGTVGELRVAYMDFAINGRLPEFMEQFRRAHPLIRLDMRYVPTPMQYEELVRKKFDVGFMIGKHPYAQANSHPFDEDRYVALVPARHALANQAAVGLTDLRTEPFVMGSGDHWSIFRERVFRLCGERGFHPRIVQEASTSEGIFGLVAAGVGVSVYSNCVRNLQRRGLVIKSFHDVSDTLGIFAVWFDDEDKPALRLFEEFLRQNWTG